MATSSNTAVNMEQGGATLAVESGGTISVKSGGFIDIKTGGIVKTNGTQAVTIAAVPTAGSADAALNAAAINSIRTVLINLGIIAAA